MLKISDAVRHLLRSYPEQYILLREDQLNLSAFATAIHSNIEEQTKKPVRRGTIVTALGRIQKEIRSEAPLVPVIALHDVSLKSGLMEIVFERTKDNMHSLQAFMTKERPVSEFVMVSYGVSELTLVASQGAKADILHMFSPAIPKLELTGLVGITLRFDETYIEQANMFYGLLRAFATHRILIVEMISTFTETTFLIHEKDVQAAMEVLQPFLQH